eukprot:EG_transcript_15849
MAFRLGRALGFHAEAAARRQCVVLGAGAVGLAVARQLAQGGRDVLVLDRHARPGMGQSSRNSEVIHAGLYYPEDSLKALCCVEGRHRLYAYCKKSGVEHRQVGKLIVATQEEELPTLQAIKEAAAANGVYDLRLLSPLEVARLEPAVRCKGALFSPSTGIVNSHELMQAYQGDAENAGAEVHCRNTVLSGEVTPEGIVLHIDADGAECTVLAQTLVNAAGIDAQSVARSLRGMPKQLIPGTWYAKGRYYSLQGPNPFRHLVYPVPVPGALGVHCTIDLAGRCRFGPDIEWVAEPDYSVQPEGADKFYAAVRKYYPDLPDDSLAPDYAGIRAKISPPGAPAADFLIQGPRQHGVPGLVHLFGIESPGLTSSLAIADRVAQALFLKPRK